jgi:hypothetical protein
MLATTSLASSASFPIVSSLPAGEEEDDDTMMTSVPDNPNNNNPSNSNKQPKRQRQCCCCCCHLILHFDINETILVGDDAGGDSREDSLNKILAKSAFVQKPVVDTSDGSSSSLSPSSSTRQRQQQQPQPQPHEDWEPTHWWNGEPIVRDQLSDNNDNDTDNTNTNTSMDEQTKTTSNIPPLYTGWDWPVGCCPYYRTRFKSRSKTFVQHHGALYRDIYDEMNRRLQPAAAAAAAGVIRTPATTSTSTTTSTEDTDPAAILTSYPILSHMLPAFFETVATLSKQKARQAALPPCACTSASPCTANKKYTIVFRTMGTDLPEIADAVTAFARGQHPDYPDFRDPDLVLTRDKLVQGRWAKVLPLPDDGGDDDSNNNDEGQQQYVFQLWQEELLVASGDAQVLEFLHAQTVCGIQDDYAFWKSQAYAPWSGKPTWIPRTRTSKDNNDGDNDNDTTACNYHHVLMDDNIHNLPNDSIASVRVENKDGTFRTLNGPEIQAQQGRSLIRVPTVMPILNPQWFLEQIEKAQRNVAASCPE